MLKSELMDLLHGLDDNVGVYFDDGTHIKKIRSAYVDRDGDFIVSSTFVINKEETK